MPRFTLTDSQRAVADANGKAIVRIGPSRAHERWHITSATVQSTSSTLVPTVRVYRGSETESRLIGGSFTGTLDTAGSDVMLQSQEDIIFVWENADVGSDCSATVNGERILP